MFVPTGDREPSVAAPPTPDPTKEPTEAKPTAPAAPQQPPPQPCAGGPAPAAQPINIKVTTPDEYSSEMLKM